MKNRGSFESNYQQGFPDLFKFSNLKSRAIFQLEFVDSTKLLALRKNAGVTTIRFVDI